MTIARKIRVHGRVQGVFFRAWTRDEAGRLGVVGWVCNCDDGSVAAHVEGDEGPVNQLVALLHNGPPHARVTSVDVDEARPEGFGDFDMRR